MDPEPRLAGVAERQRAIPGRGDVGARDLEPLHVGDGIVILASDGGVVDAHRADARRLEVGRDLGVDGVETHTIRNAGERDVGVDGLPSRSP